jgi:signal transduction histidine kinase
MLACILALALLDPSQRLSSSQLSTFVLVAGAYNLVITIFLVIRLFTQVIPPFTLLVDTALVLWLLVLSEGGESPYLIFALFPILVATLRFGWQLGLPVAGVFIIGEGLLVALSWEAGQGSAPLFHYGLHILLFILAAAVGGILSARGAAARGSSRRNLSLVPERVKMVYEMAASLSATPNAERILNAILDISRLGFDELGLRLGEAAGLVLRFGEDGRLFPASHRGLVSDVDAQRRIRGRNGIVGEAINKAEPIIGGPATDDPELKVFQSLKTCKSMICVPLRAGFETYGAVLFASVRPQIYTSEHKELLMIFCNQATIALQNADLYHRLEKERDKIVDKEEDARHKLARDLHDGPTQDVAAIAMRLNFARLLMDRDPARAKAELARLEDMAHKTVKDIRSMLFTLRPIILETEGLVAALNQYADTLREKDGLPIELDAEHYRDCLDIEAQGVVFAIIEEAVNNAKKHAEATRVVVRLGVYEDLFVAQVIDNGRGFDVAKVESNYSSRGSLGMVNLRERAELVGGNLTIESTPGRGTRITLAVPVQDDEI